jgi:hypothetical protein
LGTFWLKIEQFWPFEDISIFSHGSHLGWRTALTDTILKLWPFEEISIFSNGGHLGYRTALTNTILKGDHPRIISAKFG